MDPKLIRKNHWKRMRKLSEFFYNAALLGDVESFNLHKSNGAQFCKIGKEKMNPLHAASMKGHYNIVKILVASGIDINECRKDGKTALHLAIIYHHTKVAQLLLSSGASAECSDKVGMTPLTWAHKNKNIQIVNNILRQENRFMDGRNLTQIKPDLGERIIVSTASFQDSSKYTTDSFTCYQKNVDNYAEEDRINEEKQNNILQELDKLEKEDITIESLDLEEEDAETLTDLMRLQATIMTKEDASLMLIRLMGHGRTMELTEAGRKAFELVKPDWMFKSKDKKEEKEETKTTSALVLHKNNLSQSSTPVNYLQEWSETFNTLAPTFKYRPRVDTSPPLKRCRV